MKIYSVAFKEYVADEVKHIWVRAKNKEDAYNKAVYEMIGTAPYSAWVEGYEFKKDGKYMFHRFNTFEGKAY